MTEAAAVGGNSDPIARAELHALLRFSTGVTLTLILAEAMGWAPTFVPPLLVGVLLASLPFSPPLKVGLVLIVVMAASALLAFVLSSLLRPTPHILFGAIALIMFLAFAIMAQGRGQLPATLLLLCISTVPVIAMIAPAQAGILPTAMVRAMAVAVLTVWCMHALWPAVLPPPPRPAPMDIASPVTTALVSTAVVLPVMLVYLLFGLADALPILVTVVLLVANFDVEKGEAHGLAMMLGNLIGGAIGGLVYMLLILVPSLFTLALLTFLVAIGIAIYIGKGGAAGAIGLMTSNSYLVIISSAIASKSSGTGIWLTRLAQFAFACTFTIGLMSLAFRDRKAQPASP